MVDCIFFILVVLLVCAVFLYAKFHDKPSICNYDLKKHVRLKKYYVIILLTTSNIILFTSSFFTLDTGITTFLTTINFLLILFAIYDSYNSIKNIDEQIAALQEEVFKTTRIGDIFEIIYDDTTYQTYALITENIFYLIFKEGRGAIYSRQTKHSFIPKIDINDAEIDNLILQLNCKFDLLIKFIINKELNDSAESLHQFLCSLEVKHSLNKLPDICYKNFKIK